MCRVCYVKTFYATTDGCIVSSPGRLASKVSSTTTGTPEGHHPLSDKRISDFRMLDPESVEDGLCMMIIICPTWKARATPIMAVARLAASVLSHPLKQASFFATRPLLFLLLSSSPRRSVHRQHHNRRTISSTSPTMFNFGMKNGPSSNEQLIQYLVSEGTIKHDRVTKAMKRTDRADFCPYSPYEDCAQPLGFDATISAPHMHAYAVELLLPYLNPGARVLDVGSGSGFLTHIFAHLVCDRDNDGAGDGGNKEKGLVVGIEHIQELVELSKHNSRKSQTGRDYLDNGQIMLVAGDGRKGFPEQAPYDAIHVGAAAPESGLGVLIDQLKSPGALFVPVDTGLEVDESVFGTQTEVWVVKKDKDGHTTTDKLFDVTYVPLTDEAKQRRMYTSRM